MDETFCPNKVLVKKAMTPTIQTEIDKLTPGAKGKTICLVPRGWGLNQRKSFHGHQKHSL